MNTEYALYFDLDGVLVDFESGVRRELQKPKIETSNGRLVPSRSSGTTEFWANLDWLQGGQMLWNATKILYKNVMILSSAGTGMDDEKFSKVAAGKIEWCKKNLSLDENDIIIVPDKSMKKTHAHPTGILVDDNAKNIYEWNQACGTGILYDHIHVRDVIEELEMLAKPIKLNHLGKHIPSR